MKSSRGSRECDSYQGTGSSRAISRARVERALLPAAFDFALDSRGTGSVSFANREGQDFSRNECPPGKTPASAAERPLPRQDTVLS
jgi:hypothetical protein